MTAKAATDDRRAPTARELIAHHRRYNSATLKADDLQAWLTTQGLATVDDRGGLVATDQGWSAFVGVV